MANHGAIRPSRGSTTDCQIGSYAGYTGAHGFGHKASVLNCIPLCARSCHREYDQNPRLFAARMKIDVPGVVSKLNTFWFEKLNGGAA